MARPTKLPPAEPFGVKLNDTLVDAITKDRTRRSMTKRQMYETALVAALGLPRELVEELKLPVVSREGFKPDPELLKVPLTEYTDGTGKSNTLVMSVDLIALVRAELDLRTEPAKVRRYVERALLTELGLLESDKPAWEPVGSTSLRQNSGGTQTTLSFKTTNRTQSQKKKVA